MRGMYENILVKKDYYIDKKKILTQVRKLRL